MNSATVASPVLFYLLNPNLSNKEVQTSLHTLTHSSIRHKPFFNNIESMCRFIIELQFEPKIKQFERWMQKLLNCKSWNVWMSCWILCRQSRRPLYLIYWILIYPEIIFWKIILGHSCLFIIILVICSLKNFHFFLCTIITQKFITKLKTILL